MMDLCTELSNLDDSVVTWRNLDAANAVHAPMAVANIPAAYAAVRDAAWRMGVKPILIPKGMGLQNLPETLVDALLQDCDLHRYCRAITPPRRMHWVELPTTSHRRATVRFDHPQDGFHQVWLVATQGQIPTHQVAEALLDAVRVAPHSLAVTEGLHPDTGQYETMVLAKIATRVAADMAAIASEGLQVYGIRCRVFRFTHQRVPITSLQSRKCHSARHCRHL